jgi:hypothetical protein
MVNIPVLPSVLSSLVSEYINNDDHRYISGNMPDDEKCNYASENGYLGLLMHFRESACPWNEQTCSNAVWYGHLECLKYAHENGCSWDRWTCIYAAENGHLECLKYAHENGCPGSNAY